ncbi:hypothetical protein ALC60_14842 [Trachymyrmex zeteki]|uniref:Uncharacterized protein n=1 Tax=Mycetomoellerius zeteki TaxID=64791 RepID=A0A151WE78_9HYME|nr:hypothetical protein ALC60_14842 [Trachymyrmex zeteki]
MEKGWKGRLRILTGQVTYSMPYNNRIEILVYRLFHTHSIGEQVSGNSLRNYDTTVMSLLKVFFYRIRNLSGKFARFEQFLKRHFHRNYSLGKIASRGNTFNLYSKITATRSLVRSEKGVTFKSMHETAAISDISNMRRIINCDWSIFYDLRPYNRYNFYCRLRITISTLKVYISRVIALKNRLAIFRIAAGLNMSRIASFYSERAEDRFFQSFIAKRLCIYEIKVIANTLQPETNDGIIAIHGIRVGTLNVKAFGNRSASVKRTVVASGASEAPHIRTPGTRCSARRGGGDAGAGTWFNEGSSEHGGGGSSGGGSSSDNTYNGERSM